MYVVFQSGDKQHQVNGGQTIYLERLNVVTGEAIESVEVLVITNSEEIKIGVPFVEGGITKAEVAAHGRGERVKTVKFHRCKHYRKQQDHRQWLIDVKVTDISA